MRIFELHFNPKLKDDCVFDSFVFEPSNSYEKKLGTLLEAGELKNLHPKNQKLLDRLGKSVKERYYNISNKNAEKSISESLKQANEFLSEELKKNNVSWLGNLNFAVLSLKDSDLIFTKTGDIKVLMIRAGEITDIGKSLEIEKLNPYPLKVFFNIVTGKLIENDIIIVLTKEIYDYFNQKKALDKLAKIGILNDKNVKEIFPEKDSEEKETLKTSGLCLIISFTKDGNLTAGEKKSKSIFSQKKKEFRFIDAFLPIIIFAKSAEKKIKSLFSFGRKFQKENPKRPTKLKVRVQSPSSPSFSEIRNPFSSRKNLIIIGLFIGLIFFGFLLFQKENKRITDEKTAKKEYEQKITNLEKISDPSVLYEIKTTDGFLPEKISYSQNHIFFFNKNFQGIYDLSFEQENLSLVKNDKKFDFVVADSGLVFGLSLPNSFSFYKKEIWNNQIMEMPSGAQISQASVYYKNFYLLDNKNCKIIKVGFGNDAFSAPSNWLKDGLKQDCSNIKSIALDGSLWILNKDNSIDVFRKGEFLKNLKINVFPEPKNIVKISAIVGSPYLYLLEPEQKRIIILEKEGKLLKQIQSDKFDNLKDITVSEDGKTVYLLNGNAVFQVEI